jgi:hypothetical protein
LRFSAFLIGETDAVKDFQIDNHNSGHGNPSLRLLPGLETPRAP